MEPPVIRQLDFSEFHPLDHSLWKCLRRGYPGGWRRHLKFRWEFQWRARAGLPLCWTGRHNPVQWYRNGQPHVKACERCGTLL